MKDEIKIKWFKQPQDLDYPAAKSYLNLLYDDTVATNLTNQLKKGSPAEFKAKDIFRASGLSLLGISNYHVAKYRKKIKKGMGISPILLVRDTTNGKVIIADGFHRLCAVYSFDEDVMIPCRLSLIHI